MRKNNLKILILFLTLITLSFIPIKNCFCTEIDLYESREIQYKSITIDRNLDSYSNQELVKLSSQQENDLREYLLSNHSKIEKTGVFNVYYKNLKSIVNALNNNDLYFDDFADDGNPNLLKKLNLSFTNIESRYKIIAPKNNIIELIWIGDGFLEFNIDYCYLANYYSEYLNESWQKFLNNKRNILDGLKHCTYATGGGVTKDALTCAKWVICWENFLKEYPNFELKDEVLQDINIFTSCVLYWRKDIIDYDEKTNKQVLRKNIQNACEYFLENASRDNSGYDYIKTEYANLKKQYQ